MADTKYYFNEDNLKSYNEQIAEILRVKLGGKADSGSVYTKDEAKNTFVLNSVYGEFVTNTTSTLEGKADSDKVYSKDEIDEKLSHYILSSTDVQYATQDWVRNYLEGNVQQSITYVTTNILTASLKDYYTKTEIDEKFADYYTKNETDTKVLQMIQSQLSGNYYTKINTDNLLATKMDIASGDALSGRISTLESLINELSTNNPSNNSASLGTSVDLSNIWTWANISAKSFEFHTGANISESDTSRYGRNLVTARMYQRTNVEFDLTSHCISIKGTVIVQQPTESGTQLTTVEIPEREASFTLQTTSIFDFCNTKVKKFLGNTFAIGVTGLTYKGTLVVPTSDWNSFIKNNYIRNGETDEYTKLLISGGTYPTGTLYIDVSPYHAVEKTAPYYSGAPTGETGQVEIRWRKLMNTDSNVYNTLHLVFTTPIDGDVYKPESVKLLSGVPGYYKKANPDNLKKDGQRWVTASLEENGGKYKLLYKDKSGYTNIFENKSQFISLLRHITTTMDSSNTSYFTVFYNGVIKDTYESFTNDEKSEIDNLLEDIGYTTDATADLDTTNVIGQFLNYIKFRYGEDVKYVYDKVFQKQSDIFDGITQSANVTSIGGSTGDIVLDSDVAEPGNVKMWIDTTTTPGTNVLRGYVNPIDPVVIVRTGMIMMWPKMIDPSNPKEGDIPLGYLLCNGQSISKDSFASLYAVVGDQFTEAPSGDSFNLPDMEGIVRGIHYIIKI